MVKNLCHSYEDRILNLFDSGIIFRTKETGASNSKALTALRFSKATDAKL